MGEIVKDDIEKLKDKLTANIKATEDLANSDIPKTEPANPPKENTSRLLEFMASSIKEKENDLECPVCLETADVPIFMCSEMHLICSSCKQRSESVRNVECPIQAPPRDTDMLKKLQRS